MLGLARSLSTKGYRVMCRGMEGRQKQRATRRRPAGPSRSFPPGIASEPRRASCLSSQQALLRSSR